MARNSKAICGRMPLLSATTTNDSCSKWQLNLDQPAKIP